MRELSDRLSATVAAAEPRLRAISAAESQVPLLHGGWSRRQVLGHLIDSASNNHQRFVRAILQGSLEFPGYDQEGNVRLQSPQDADWSLLISLWASYNHYLAHVIARFPSEKLSVPVSIGSKQPVTLSFLAEDYLTHMLHHLKQIGVCD